MYSSGNIDVRNWVHLFESRCIIVYRQFAWTASVTCANSDVATPVVTAKSLWFLLPDDGSFTVQPKHVGW